MVFLGSIQHRLGTPLAFQFSMAKQKNRKFENPDERRPFQANGYLDVVEFDDGVTIGRAVFEPGWKWSNDVKPIAQTETCEVPHSGYCLQGSMTVRMNDGETFTIRAGEAFHIPPGHDAWVEGADSCVLLDVGGYTRYAKRAA